MDFVWIYAKRFSSFYKSGQFNELDYSIRSVRKNYQGDTRCFVVGDDPGLDVIHLKAPPVVMKDEVYHQPQHFDLMNKFEVILNSDIKEEFVLMYDDIFMLKPTPYEEITKTYGRCELDNVEEYIRTGRDGGTPYKKVWLMTYNYIQPYRNIKGLKTYDWETHLPRFMEKKHLKWLIDRLNLKHLPMIPTSLYSAHFGGETFLIEPGFQSDIWTHRPGMDFDPEFACHYMNIGDHVIVPEFIERMRDVFGK
jgi:hypothetical protein